MTSARHPSVGETILGTSFRAFPGGKGANQAVASARAGAETIMLGMVGDDAAGSDLLRYLDASGVDVAGVRRSTAAPTGTALVTVAGGDNTIVVVPGANGELAAEGTLLDAIGPEDVVLAQFETPLEATAAAFARAKARGSRTLLNPAPASSIPDDLLPLVDYLVVNESEFALTFGFDPTAPPPEPRPGAFSEYRGTIVSTLGAAGVIAWPAGERRDPLVVHGIAIDAVDSTGAGDCFCGYLAAGICQGSDLRDALRLANSAAAISVTRPGAASSIPGRSEVDV